jgi:cbb3-type cytochrome oxidase maturation protein
VSLGGLILLSLCLGVGAWLFFIWTVKSGQYEDPEGPKYRMLEEDEERDASPPPGGAKTPGGPGPRGRADPPSGGR